MMINRILFFFLITSIIGSCSQVKKGVRCIQFVHVGTSDKLDFSSVISIDDSWCQIDVEYSTDTISIAKMMFDQRIISKIESFFSRYPLTTELSNKPYSGYEIRIVSDTGTLSKMFILTREENERVFSELIEHLENENSPDELIDFIRKISERGYFFYG